MPCNLERCHIFEAKELDPEMRPLEQNNLNGLIKQTPRIDSGLDIDALKDLACMLVGINPMKCQSAFSKCNILLHFFI